MALHYSMIRQCYHAEVRQCIHYTVSKRGNVYTIQYHVAIDHHIPKQKLRILRRIFQNSAVHRVSLFAVLRSFTASEELFIQPSLHCNPHLVQST
jgi:hypothetical protein